MENSEITYSKYTTITDLYQSIEGNQGLCNALGVNVSVEGKCFAIVAMQNDEPIGFIVALNYEREIMHIEFIIVLDQFQNRGIGSTLLKKIEKYATKKGFEQLTLVVNQHGNQPAKKLYEKLGFKMKDEDDEDKYVDMIKWLN